MDSQKSGVTMKASLIKPFSIIVPTYNRSELLPACIASLRSQVYPQESYEIVVVDNNSTDETLRVIEELNRQGGKEIRYVLEKRPGLMEARHSGARAASGEILAYIDDDAVADRNWICELASAYNELDADCAGGKIFIRWDKVPPKWIIPYEPILGKLDHGKDMKILNNDQFINGSSFSIVKKRLFEIGGFNPDQIGDFLIGDGETGLCRKIHAKGWHMVWVPNAIVWHLQFVDKNATLLDMSRRFRNNGICAVFALFKNEELTLDNILDYKKKIRHQHLRLTLKYFSRRFGIDYYNYKVRKAFLKGQKDCILRLISDQRYREFIKKEDWINPEILPHDDF